MKIYVAGKTQDRAKVRQVQELVRHTGHEITYDWTAIVEKHGGDSNEVPIPQELRRSYALNDLGGVYSADVMIACGNPNLCGTFWECGMAAAFNVPIWLLWWEECSRHSIFEDLPHVTKVRDIQTLGENLWALSQGGANLLRRGGVPVVTSELVEPHNYFFYNTCPPEW